MTYSAGAGVRALLATVALVLVSFPRVSAAAGRPPVAGGARAAIAADERITFSHLITSVAAGTNPSYLALNFADGAREVLWAGAVALRIPPQAGPAASVPIQWIPGTDRVVYALRSGSGAERFYVNASSGITPDALPACVAGSGVDTLSGAVAWWCGKDLYIDPVVGASMMPPSVYTMPAEPLPTPGSFAVARTVGGLVAVRTHRGATVFTLHGALLANIPLSPAAHVFNMLWSPHHVLAIVSSSAVWLWSQALGLRRFSLAPAGNEVQWAPDGVSLLAVATDGYRGGARLFRVERLGWDGASSTVEAGRLGFLLGFAQDGVHFWREEGVAQGVYAVPADPGRGPFRLSFQSLPEVPAAARLPLPQVNWLEMATPRLGWAVDSSGNHLLLTTDGGRDWTEVTPPGYLLSPFGWLPGYPGRPLYFRVPRYYPLLGIGDAATTFFLRASACTEADCTDGWAYAAEVPGATGGATLLFTSDGGGRWVNLHPHGAPAGRYWRQPPLLNFTSPSDGWMMVFPSCMGGCTVLSDCPGGCMELYRTRNGGRIWRRVLVPIAPPPATGTGGGGIGVLPQGMGFLDASTGWITGVAHGAAWLDETADGGHTWNEVRLPVPPGYRNALVMTAPPRFLGAGFGVLPVYLSVRFVSAGSISGYAPFDHEGIYVTRDAGIRWTAGRPTGFGLVDILDPTHMWTLTSARLLESTDGGLTWQTVLQPPDQVVDSTFAFVSPTNGMAMGEAVTGEAVSSALYRTQDGGRTWRSEPSYLICPSSAPVKPGVPQALC